MSFLGTLPSSATATTTTTTTTNSSKRPRRSSSSSSTAAAATQSSSSSTKGGSTIASLPTLSVDERISRLRRNLAVSYDGFVNYGMQWGSLSICWGPVANENLVLNVNDAFPTQYNDEQTVYFAGRTDGTLRWPSSATGSAGGSESVVDGNGGGGEGDDDGVPIWEGQPGELFVARVAIPKPRTTRRNQLKIFQETTRSSRVGLEKRIVHPGEVNRLRTLPTNPNFVVSKSESPNLFVWNVKSQEHRVLHPSLVEQSSFPTPTSSSSSSAAAAAAAATAPITTTTTTTTNKRRGGQQATATIKTRCSVPDVTLVGQTTSSEFALDCSTSNAFVASGTSEGYVTCWSLEDFSSFSKSSSRLAPRAALKIHSSALEDCAFSPRGDTICTVGRDRALCVWDFRSKSTSSRSSDAHSDDVNCCHWNPLDANRIATGGSDALVKVWDTRRMATPVMTHAQHGSVINVRWCPFEPNVFAASDEESWFTIYDAGVVAASSSRVSSPVVIFQHFGHRGSVVDFSWNAANPFVLATVSDDSQVEARGGGGTMQVWRVNELVLGARLGYRACGSVASGSASPAAWMAEMEEKFGPALASVLASSSSSVPPTSVSFATTTAAAAVNPNGDRGGGTDDD